MTSLESLLADLAASNWTISWAFQFAPDHWRVSIIHHSDIGEALGTYISHCADAPSFAEALEDAMCRRNDAVFVADTEPEWTTAAPLSLTDLLTQLIPHRPTQPFPRRL